MKSKMSPGWKDKFILAIRKWFGMDVILCDTCKWNWRGACHNSARPNATWCSEYEKRG